MGFCNPQIGLRVTGYASELAMKPGGVAFITQSGSAFSALAYSDQRLKFSVCVSSGRELTTTAGDYLDWALDQPDTRVVGLFLETARDPERFRKACEKADRLGIPVVVLKVGRTELSADFAASHSGAIAGDDAAYEALFVKMGRGQRRHVGSACRQPAFVFAGQARRQGWSGQPARFRRRTRNGGGPRRCGSACLSRRCRTRRSTGCVPISIADCSRQIPLDVWGSGRDFEVHVEACMDAMLADPDTAIGVLFQDIRDGSYVAERFCQGARRFQQEERQACRHRQQLFRR